MEKWRIERYDIPEYMHGALLRYINDGLRPGDFLSSVICNNLALAVGMADDINIQCLPACLCPILLQRSSCTLLGIEREDGCLDEVETRLNVKSRNQGYYLLKVEPGVDTSIPLTAGGVHANL